MLTLHLCMAMSQSVCEFTFLTPSYCMLAMGNNLSELPRDPVPMRVTLTYKGGLGTPRTVIFSNFRLFGSCSQRWSPSLSKLPKRQRTQSYRNNLKCIFFDWYFYHYYALVCILQHMTFPLFTDVLSVQRDRLIKHSLTNSGLLSSHSLHHLWLQNTVEANQLMNSPNSCPSVQHLVQYISCL